MIILGKEKNLLPRRALNPRPLDLITPFLYFQPLSDCNILVKVAEHSLHTLYTDSVSDATVQARGIAALTRA